MRVKSQASWLMSHGDLSSRQGGKSEKALVGETRFRRTGTFVDNPPRGKTVALITEKGWAASGLGQKTPHLELENDRKSIVEPVESPAHDYGPEGENVSWP